MWWHTWENFCLNYSPREMLPQKVMCTTMLYKLNLCGGTYEMLLKIWFNFELLSPGNVVENMVNMGWRLIGDFIKLNISKF